MHTRSDAWRDTATCRSSQATQWAERVRAHRLLIAGAPSKRLMNSGPQRAAMLSSIDNRQSRDSRRKDEVPPGCFIPETQSTHVNHPFPLRCKHDPEVSKNGPSDGDRVCTQSRAFA